LQIAPALINELFAAVVGAAAIAFGLAFGLGGQDTARRWLSRGESTVSSAAAQMQAQQNYQQMQAEQMQAQPNYQQTQPQQMAYPQQAYQQPYAGDASTQSQFNRPPTR